MRAEEVAMFLDELTPLVRELMGHPVAFLGGFASGVLRLNLGDEPVKSWLEKQGGAPPQSLKTANSDHNGDGPQKISID